MQPKIKVDYFQPCQPMQLQNKYGGEPLMFFGLNQLQFVAAQVAASVLAKCNPHDGEKEDYSDWLQGIAITAVDIAKAILQRCHDEQVVAAADEIKPASPLVKV